MAAAVGPVEVRRMMTSRFAFARPRWLSTRSLNESTRGAGLPAPDVAMSLRGHTALDRLFGAYLQKPIGVHVPVVGGFGQSAFD